MEFGKRLRELRENRGLTQDELAKELGVTKGAVSNWEKNVRKPKSTEMMEAIADFFNVDMNYLYGMNYDIETDVNEMLKQLQYRPEMRMLFSLSAKATPEHVARTIKILTALDGDS